MRAADTHQPLSIALHLFVLGKPFPHIAKDAGGIRIVGYNDSIVNPFPLPSCFNDPSLSEVR